MIGQKLYELLSELEAAQSKSILHYCNISSDKRLAILKLVITNRKKTSVEINDILSTQVIKTWPNISEKEHNLKMRRLANFFSEEIEKIILEEYLTKNNTIRNLLLAKAKENHGNIHLISNYYSKAYLKSLDEEELLYRLLALKGKIRMSYASQSEKEFDSAISLNEEFKDVLYSVNEKATIDYYNNLSNIYLEKNSLIKESKEKLEIDVLFFINSTRHQLHKASLYVSLAKLNYDNEKLSVYFSKADELLYSEKNKSKEYYDLERKLVFLKLRLNFFAGETATKLIEISDQILKQKNAFSVINNNTMFYKILSYILLNEIEKSKEFIENSASYFKGEGQLLKNFLMAVIYEKEGNYRKALHLLNPMMYASNYFFAIFSRLLVIKIHVKRSNDRLLESLLDSTVRFLKANDDNSLGKESNDYVLKVFRSRILRKHKESLVLNSHKKLSCFHIYLLEE
jgi:hypothetical protein